MSFKDKLKFGTIYKAKNLKKVWNTQTLYAKNCPYPEEDGSVDAMSLNNQRYNTWVPVYVPEREMYGKPRAAFYCMIDTYQLSRDLFPTEGTIEDIAEVLTNKLRTDGFWAYCKSLDYFYKSAVILDESNFKMFEEWFDINDYEEIDRSESRKYADEDVVDYVKLWHECRYRNNGFTLVRKGAGHDVRNKVQAITADIIEDIAIPRIGFETKYLVSELEQIIENCPADSYNYRRAEAVLKFVSDIEQLANEFNQRYAKYRNDLYNQ